jgi:hypothetical protein
MCCSAFGKSKIYTALVIDTHQNQPTLYDAKEIHQILDERPIVTIVQVLANGLRLIICVQSVMYMRYAKRLPRKRNNNLRKQMFL